MGYTPKTSLRSKGRRRTSRPRGFQLRLPSHRGASRLIPTGSNRVKASKLDEGAVASR